MTVEKSHVSREHSFKQCKGSRLPSKVKSQAKTPNEVVQDPLTDKQRPSKLKEEAQDAVSSRAPVYHLAKAAPPALN